MNTATKRYLAGWSVAGLIALTVLLLSSDLRDVDPMTLVVMIAIITTAELIVVHIDLGRAGAIFTLSEAAIMAGLLLVAPVHVVGAAALAMLIAHLPRRLSFDKIVFNVSQVTTATSIAGIVMLATPDLGPTVGARALATALLAMGAYAAVNALAFRGLVSRVAGREGLADFDEQAPLTLASLLGTVAVGTVAAALWGTQPWLIPLLLVPVFAIQVAARSSLAAASLVSTLRAERDRLDQVVRGASDGILLLDAEATIRVWSPALSELTGITQQDAVGRAAGEVLTPERRQGADTVTGRWVIEDARPDHRQHRFHVRWWLPSGEVRDVQEDHALVFDERGNCTGDVVLLRDVSREAELERLRADFVASISHELRTPLTPIRGYVQLLLQRGDRLSEQQRQDALTSVLARTDRLGELVEDLLLVTQVERGELDGVVTPEPTAIGEVVARVVADAAAREPQRAFDLDDTNDTPLVWADAPRLRQALTSLVDNAVRYSPGGSPVHVSVRPEGHHLTIRVRDYGPGIPAGQRERIFERFQRLEDPLTMRTGGVGLGLFIARRLAEAMRGSLELEDGAPGHTTFVLRLATARPSDGSPPTDALDGPTGLPGAPEHGPEEGSRSLH